ncbi:hypothetical protein MMC12_000824 [Toensbergia leucococca]|nr:hypothetical protein [Toensbergia leucococca]
MDRKLDALQDTIHNNKSSIKVTLTTILNRLNNLTSLPIQKETTRPGDCTKYPLVEQGHFLANTGYDPPLPLPPVVPPSLQGFRASDIGYFHPGLEVSKEYPAGDIVNVGKDLYYRDVLLFVQQVKHVASIKKIENLSLCLQGSAMQWFASLDSNTQSSMNREHVIFTNKLTIKYRLSPALALNKMHQQHYTMKDAQNLRPADEYIQAMLRYERAAGMIGNGILVQAWQNLHWELQRDVFCPTENTTPDDLVARIDQVAQV